MDSRPTKTRWMDGVDHWTTPILANMFFVLVSLPLITIPLALAGLMGIMVRWTQHKNPEVFTTFIRTIRRNWLKCYIVAGIDVLVCGLIYVNVTIFQMMGGGDAIGWLARGVTLFFAIALVVMNVFVWTLMPVWDKPLSVIIKSCFQLVFAQPIWSILTGIGVCLVLVVSLVMPPAFWLTCTAAIAGYVACRGTWFVLTKYVSPDDFSWLELE